MTGYKFKIQNISGEFFFINDFTTDPLRFFALQNYPDFEVDIKNSEVQKEGQHGVFDFFSFYGKRVINFQGVIVGETEEDVEVLKAKLLKVVSLPPIPTQANDGTVTVTWTDADSNNWQINGKLQGYPRFERGMRQGSRLYFTLTLKCKNPEIESQEETSVDSERGWQQGALTIPVVLPAIFSLIYNKEFTATNVGMIASHTNLKLTGESGIVVNNPYVINKTTGKMFKVNIALTDATKYILINSKTGTVVDQDGVDQSGLVDSESEYILLDIGDNQLVYLSDESWNASSPVNTWIEPTAEVNVKHRKTII